ncbi:MAG: hypothetical protein HYR59_06280 [Acidobacteria bacterium]|nr:hypothetical protein [Acidobacteriota bacterium]
MLRRPYFRLIIFLLFLLGGGIANAQERQLERSFSVGAPHRYRVRLTLRSELEAQRPVPIGAKTYVEPFSRSAEVTLSWRATSRVAAVADDGAAVVEEVLDEFEAAQSRVEPADDDAKKMSAALAGAVEAWRVPRTLRYRETPAGQLLGLPPDGVPALGENAPPLLTLWLLRALRPAVTLPGKPIVFGERWQDPRAVKLENWSNVRGVESGEWLEVPGGAEPAVRLHVVQQISGNVAAGSDMPEAGAAQARFHAESLTTLALLDGRVLSAERSAVREISRTFEAVPGLPGPQRFRARLSVQVQIEDCQDNPCLAPSSPVVMLSPLPRAKHLSSYLPPSLSALRSRFVLSNFKSHISNPVFVFPGVRFSNFEFRTSNLELQSSPSPQRIKLAPKLVPGQSLRYQIDARTVTTSRSSGRIEDPQGPAMSEVNLAAVVRLEILASSPDAPLRIRTTYEKSSAIATSDSYDPALAVLEEQYRKLEGRSLEFSLDAQGKAVNFTGLDGSFPDEKAAAAAREWFSQLAAGGEFPREGIIPGQSWTSEQTNPAGVPLLGLTWRTESTYLRDAPCPAAEPPAPAPAAPTGTCAVIRTRLSVTQRPLKDPTPDDYRLRNLRTSGTLSGSGESLSYISLRTGWLVRVTQTSSEETDIVLLATDGGSQLRINGRVESTTHITLLPEEKLK